VGAVLLVAGSASGQSVTTAGREAPAPALTGALEQSRSAQPEPSSPWSFAASVYAYLPVEDPAYLQPSLTADNEVVHLEGRYNYEDRATASAWIGYGFHGGTDLAWELGPMLGGVFGRTNGIAPGYRGSLSFWKLELYSEGELLVAFDADESFFYDWSELALAPAEWARFGIMVQRTRAYATERDLQRGLLAGASYSNASLTLYLLNPDDEAPLIIVSARASFD
jgi:hypothetical protein